MNDYDPHDPGGRLAGIQSEFGSRVEHDEVSWKPGDPMLTDEAVRASQKYFARMVAKQQAQERIEAGQRQTLYEKEKKASRLLKVKKFFAVLALSAAGYGIFAPGVGAVDRVGAVMTDAEDTAEIAIVNPQDGLDDLYDSPLFSDMTPEEIQRSIAETNAEQVRARSIVINLIKEVDEKGYGSLVERVNVQKQNYPDVFVPKADIDAARAAIESASSNNEVVHALNEFMRYYDITASFANGEFTEKNGQVKNVANAYIDVFSQLPRDFIALAKLKEVTIAAEGHTSDDTHGIEGGSYEAYDGKINVVALSRAFELLAAPDEIIRGEDFSFGAVVAHELGHAIVHNYKAPVKNGYGTGEELHVHLPESQKLDVVSEDSDPFKIIYEGYIEGGMRTLAQRPEVPSLYSRSSNSEYQAELLSGLLSNKDGGLASVNEWRRFGSESNKAMLQVLADLEQLRPGIAEIIVANRQPE